MSHYARPRYYVTVGNGEQTAWLLGPYRTRKEALANVARGRRLAEEADPFAPFYVFGITRTTARITPVFHATRLPKNRLGEEPKP